MKIMICDHKQVLGENAFWQKKYLQQHLPNVEVEIYYYEGNREELYEKCREQDGILTAFLPMDEEFLEHCEKLLAISISAVGYNTLCLQKALEKNITVMTLDEYCTEEVADHTMALILSLARGLKQYENNIWGSQQFDYVLPNPITRLRNQKLGIFGYGRIGRAVAARAKAFGMMVYVYQNPRHPIEQEDGINLASAEDIFRDCHIITNHMPQSKENYHFFNINAFEQMQQKPIFINTGRGSAVDEDALKKAIEKQQISSAGLDVLESENPLVNQYRWLQQKNVILTPHAAFYSKESLEDLRRISCDNLIYYFTGKHDLISKKIGFR